MNKNRNIVPLSTDRLALRSFPVSGYVLLLVLGTWVLLYWLKSTLTADNETIHYLLHFMQKFFGGTIITLLLVSFLSVFIPWLRFKSISKKKDFHFALTTENAKVTVSSAPFSKPFGGFLRLQLVAVNWTNSPIVALQQVNPVKKEKREWTFEAFPQYEHIEAYQIEEVRLFFLDFLHFFRFAVRIPRQILIVNQPQNVKIGDVDIIPLKTQSDTEKIYSNRKSAGDLYNFKQYESHDDFRRIVWPLFAKTGEIMVRNPEIQNQYASDAVMFASFHQSISVGDKELSSAMLDYYKNTVFSTYQQQVEKKECAVFFQTDQNTHTPFSKMKEAQDHIATCQWQQKQGIDQLPRPDQTSLVIVSSLDDIQAIASLVGKSTSRMRFSFVPLSAAFPKATKKQWLQWFFFRSGPNNTVTNYLRWLRFPNRKKLIENEQKISKILAVQNSRFAVR